MYKFYLFLNRQQHKIFSRIGMRFIILIHIYTDKYIFYIFCAAFGWPGRRVCLTIYDQERHCCVLKLSSENKYNNYKMVWCRKIKW